MRYFIVFLHSALPTASRIWSYIKNILTARAPGWSGFNFVLNILNLVLFLHVVLSHEQRDLIGLFLKGPCNKSWYKSSQKLFDQLFG